MKRKCNSSLESGSTSNDTTGALYDVFLSFRGEDTRMTFTDTLYHALLNKGIRVFIDKKGIDVGDEIGPEIYQAIDDSKVCIPIFSTGYASSRWCLRELEHMMKRRKTYKLEVMPIFYDVDPSVVKLETGVYRDALTQRKRERGNETVKGWEEALKEVTKVKGWDAKNRGHGELTRQIAVEVLGKLNVSPVHLVNPLIGIDKSVDKVIDLLSVDSRDVRFIGICGIGGIGKTTLAKVVYKKLLARFQSCSFIHNIQQASESSSFGLLYVQRQLVHDILGDNSIEIPSIDEGQNMIEKRFNDKKVLIILDDVNDGRQLRALAAKRKWFGLGSRILVTTRDKNVLSVFENSLSYEVEELNSQESLELFSKHAFGSNNHFPPSDFLSLSEKATAKAGGLPLTIEVISSLLRGQGKTVWEETLKKMEKYPHKDVLKHLMLSYEALDCTQKKIFLDIASFLAGKNERDATYMWEDCNLFPAEGIHVLLSRSLVKIGENNELWMHDQLKDLGRSIVLNENQNNPGKRSRVWNHKEALDMITRKKGTETVEAICIDSDGISLASEEFKKMPDIRYLEMISGNLSGDFKGVFPELRWLSWKNCPSILQATHFFPKELLILDLSRSGITQHWNGWTQLKVATRLKVLNLSFCRGLATTPDLSAYLSLEILILEDCRNLVTIDKSIRLLTRLKHLNLKRCFHLQFLPAELGNLEALTELLISTGYGLLPTDLEVPLFTDYGLLREVPSSFGELRNLKCLAICGAFSLKRLPDSIGMLICLIELDVSNTGIVELPNTISKLECLKVLKVNGSHMQKLPEAIGKLENLEEIYGLNCKWLETIPNNIARLPFLKILKLTKTCMKDVPEFLQSLLTLCLTSQAPEKAPETSNLGSLRYLELSSMHFGSIYRGEGTYGPCCHLQLTRITSISSYLGYFRCLKELRLECGKLRHIRQLPSSLRKLKIVRCNSLEVFDLSNLENLLELELGGQNFNVQGLEGLTSLECLRVRHCKSSEFSGLERLENLRLLLIADCSSLQTLPNLSNFENLEDFKLLFCPKLVEIEGLDRLESLERFEITYCRSLRLPDLSHLKKLKIIWARESTKFREIFCSSN
ncbi:hypothetical protein BT93_C0925 [Corymbia citriodora subsp. variegata]|nr:hypothetical protein BT93_C0925 [Corymbia citriodora subsp. variegata]